MARTYDGPTVSKGKVQRPVREAESEAKDTAGAPPSTSGADRIAKKTDSGPSKEGADDNKSMFGDLATRHTGERKAMQDRHHAEMGSVHDKHMSEHKDLMKRGGDAEERLAMHARHHHERHTMHGHHGQEHAEMAHRHAAEMRGEAPNKEEAAATGKAAATAGKPKELGKAEDKGKGGTEGT